MRQYPARPAAVLSRLRARTGKSIRRHTLRRFNLSWERFRRSLWKKRVEKAFRVAQDELAELLSEPCLDVVYFDEAGFSLAGVVPYGWLPASTRTDIPVTGDYGSTVQAIGFEHQDATTQTYVHEGSVDTQRVIEIMEEFCETIDQTMVVILDNASCHTSGVFQACVERWAQRGLRVDHLPPYNPEVNSIERLWKS